MHRRASAADKLDNARREMEGIARFLRSERDRESRRRVVAERKCYAATAAGADQHEVRAHAVAAVRAKENADRYQRLCENLEASAHKVRGAATAQRVIQSMKVAMTRIYDAERRTDVQDVQNTMDYFDMYLGAMNEKTGVVERSLETAPVSHVDEDAVNRMIVTTSEQYELDPRHYIRYLEEAPSAQRREQLTQPQSVAVAAAPASSAVVCAPPSSEDDDDDDGDEDSDDGDAGAKDDCDDADVRALLECMPSPGRLDPM